MCTEQAYAMYLERMDRKPAPMQSDFVMKIAKGQIDVAVRDTRLVGYAVFYPDAERMHLENVAVLPAFRGQGIGKKLIDHVELAARGAGYDAVELYTNAVMTENRAMYLQLGYLEVGHQRDDGFDRVFFRKTL